MLGGKQTNIKMGGDFDPIPADKYTVQIADVNLVTQFNKWKGEDQELLNYHYIVLDNKATEVEGETTRGRYLWHRMGQSLGARSWLFKLVKAVYGRELSREELEAFSADPESIVGKQVDVMIEQNPSKDGTKVFNNIISYSKTLKNLESVEFTPGQKDKEVESTPINTVDTPDLLPKGGLSIEEAFEGQKDVDADMEEFKRFKEARAKEREAERKEKVGTTKK